MSLKLVVPDQAFISPRFLVPCRMERSWQASRRALVRRKRLGHRFMGWECNHCSCTVRAGMRLRYKYTPAGSRLRLSKFQI